MKRLLITLLASILFGNLATAAVESATAERVRIGLTSVFLDDRVEFLRTWRNYLEEHLQRPVEFVQRTSYREISEMLLRGDLDVAWTCGVPYVRYRPAFQLVAVPHYQGAPLYRSYLITSAHNHDIQAWQDLRGRVFAYSDPDSNSGFLYPQFAMQQQGLNPARLFRRSFFTWAHRNVVEAVASGLADAGAVDSYVWETLAMTHPELTVQTRVVLKSPEFGHPPIVAGAQYKPADIADLQLALMDMERSPEGQRLLRILNLDGFATGDPSLYDSIERMMITIDPHARP